MKGSSLVIATAGILLVCFSGVLAQDTLREKITQRLQERNERFHDRNDREFSFVHDGIVRKYKVHFPSQHGKETPLPVVIFLHGGGGSMRQAYDEGMDAMSDKYGFLLIVPAGTGPRDNMFLTWNAGKWEADECCGSAVRDGVDDVGFLERVISEVKRAFRVDDKRIFATGISNGGMMSYRLACALSDTIAAVAVVAPPAVPQSCKPEQPVSIMHIHGTADPCVPFQGGEGAGCMGKKRLKVQSANDMVNFWIRQDKCSQDYKTTYQKGKASCITNGNCAGGSEVKFCTIEGGGHVWPSGHQYFSAERVGPVSYDMSFEQIWNFFEKHTLAYN